MEEKNDKLKLTVEEQVKDMMSKNIQFELYSIDDAKKFLKYNNYYFKLKSYARNYNINPQTKKISSKVQTAVKTANKTNMSLGGLNTPYLSLT